MRIVVAYSGGKDSQACLLWAAEKYGVDKIEAVFCDTGWENPVTYQHILSTTESLGVKLNILKSKKYKGFEDMVLKKGGFPSSTRRFCTQELKVIPMIDYLLSLNDHFIVIEGIRAKESVSRSKLTSSCRFFKHYFTPYGYNKKGKPKYHTYRKRDVLSFCKNYSDDIRRPIFSWDAEQVMDYIISKGQKPNPLYYRGFRRVGCFPCIQCRLAEVKQIVELFPLQVERINRIEEKLNRSFFPPKYIPNRFCTGLDKNGKVFPWMRDVKKYIIESNATGMFSFNEDGENSCISYYKLCE